MGLLLGPARAERLRPPAASGDPVTFGGGVALGVGALGDVDGDGLGELWLDHITVDRTTFSFLPGISVYRGGRSLRTLPTALQRRGGRRRHLRVGAVPTRWATSTATGTVTCSPTSPDGRGASRPTTGRGFRCVWAGPWASERATSCGIFDCTATIVGRGDFDADGFTDLVMRRCQPDTSLTLAIVSGGTSVATTLVDLPRCGADPLRA